jgi:hypothetical protein
MELDATLAGAAEINAADDALHPHPTIRMATTKGTVTSRHCKIKWQPTTAKTIEPRIPTPPSTLQIGTTVIPVASTSKNGTPAPHARTQNQAINHSATGKTSRATKTPAIDLQQRHNTKEVFHKAPDGWGQQ